MKDDWSDDEKFLYAMGIKPDREVGQMAAKLQGKYSHFRLARDLADTYVGSNPQTSAVLAQNNVARILPLPGLKQYLDTSGQTEPIHIAFMPPIGGIALRERMDGPGQAAGVEDPTREVAQVYLSLMVVLDKKMGKKALDPSFLGLCIPPGKFNDLITDGKITHLAEMLFEKGGRDASKMQKNLQVMLKILPVIQASPLERTLRFTGQKLAYTLQERAIPATVVVTSALALGGFLYQKEISNFFENLFPQNASERPAQKLQKTRGSQNSPLQAEPKSAEKLR